MREIGVQSGVICQNSRRSHLPLRWQHEARRSAPIMNNMPRRLIMQLATTEKKIVNLAKM
jgi:hypothetical protein